MPIRILPKGKGRSFRNRLEELGRVDAERGDTEKGKRNLREEKDRIRSELKRAEGPKPTARMSKAVGGVAKSAQHPHSKLKTQKELKKITDSSAYKKADYKGKTKMLGGSTYTAAEMEKRINKAKGGIGKLKQTERKAGPSAPSPRKKRGRYNPFTKTRGGGPDSGNIGKLKDSLSKAYDKYKDKLGKKVGPSPEDLQRIRDKMKKPKQMQPLRKGGRARGPNRPRPTGPHMWVRGDKRKKYASGGVVMAGKKVGCQIK